METNLIAILGNDFHAKAGAIRSDIEGGKLLDDDFFHGSKLSHRTHPVLHMRLDQGRPSVVRLTRTVTTNGASRAAVASVKHFGGLIAGLRRSLEQ
ncbi:MAG: hypothetical protein JO347_07810 [Candidatus Eremiobacteraeota bacterium]|nr:hypothetical protein [Candidatus Eremiobacteraeota bacterium]